MPKAFDIYGTVAAEMQWGKESIGQRRCVFRNHWIYLGLFRIFRGVSSGIEWLRRSACVPEMPLLDEGARRFRYRSWCAEWIQFGYFFPSTVLITKGALSAMVSFS